MAKLIISQKKKGKLNVAIPHYLLVNGQMAVLFSHSSSTQSVISLTSYMAVQK